MSNKAASKADVLQGTLDLMVLQTLGSLGAQHGYAIASRLEQVSGGALPLVEAAKASLSRWQVEPARVNGAPVVSGVVLQVRFGPK